MVAASSAAKFSSTLQHEQHLGAATASLALILMLILVSSLPQLH